MFFICTVNEKEKNLDFCQPMECDVCRKFGRFEVFVCYMVLALFFIPVFKWNKKYFVKTSCCNTVYELKKEIGKKIEKHEDILICSDDIKLRSRGSFVKSCPYCGFEVEECFEYCPKCGRKI